MQHLRRAAAGLAAAVLMSACGPQAGDAPAPPAGIGVDGSSTVYPLTLAVAEAYRGERADIPEITVAESGTTAGFGKLCAGAVDIIGASRPIGTAEIIDCFRGGVRYVEIPVGFDGVTVIVHPGNPVRSATIEDLRAIWRPEAQGVVQTWRDVNPRWPAAPLALFGPGAASGTFDYFTEAVIGQPGASRTDYTASEDDTVIVAGVMANPNALGYLGVAYYEQNKERLRALAIDGGAGPVAPSADAIADGQYQPLSRPIFIYVSAAALDKPGVQAFVEYYVNNASRLIADVGYIPLPESAYGAYLERVRARRTGTAFSGRTVMGATIEEIINRPLIESSSS